MNSISNIQYFKNCPLSYRYHNIIGLRKIDDESADHHLKFGLAFHKAMEVIYKAHRAWGEVQGVLGNVSLSQRLQAAILDKAKAAFLATYPKQLDESDNAKTQESGCAAIESYYALYGEDDRKRWRVLSVEAADTYDDGFNLHLDLVAEDMEQGGIYGFDFKTTKKPLDYTFFGRFQPSSQITRYVNFIRDRYGSCEGFYIRATRFGYRSRMYKGEPVGFYIQHEQQLFNVNDAQIQMEKASDRYWQLRIASAGVNDEYGMNTDHCPFCQYRPVCSSGWTWPEDEQLILNQYRLVCNETTANLRACLLDPGHEGDHSEERPPAKDDLEIEVEI